MILRLRAGLSDGCENCADDCVEGPYRLGPTSSDVMWLHEMQRTHCILASSGMLHSGRHGYSMRLRSTIETTLPV